MHKDFAAYAAHRRAEAEAKMWAPDWEERKKQRIIARRPLVRFHAAKRKAAKLQRTPKWADMSAIQAFYAEAHEKTQETGVEHVVDHIIPLQGKLVSGLHVQGNLRVITGSENSRKHAKFSHE